MSLRRSKHRNILLGTKIFFCFLALLSGFLSTGDVAAHHPILTASTNTHGKQDHATLAVGENGIALITWHADNTSLDAPNSYTHLVLARLYDSVTGSFLSEPFRLDLANRLQQSTPDVAADFENNLFIISWAARDPDLGWNAYYRIIDDQGRPIIPASFEEKYKINVSASTKKIFPDVAVYENGDFVIAWEEVRDNQMNYFLRLVKTNPLSLGNICTVNSRPVLRPPTDRYGLPDVAVHQSGLAAVAWENVTDSSVSAFLSIVDPANCTLKSETVVDLSSNIQRRPIVDIGTDDSAIVTWTEGSDDPDLPYMRNIFFKRFTYSPNGPIPGARMSVNDEPPGWRSRPAVHTGPCGGFAVSWSDYGRILFRIYDENLTPLNEPTQINGEASLNWQTRPAFGYVDLLPSSSCEERPYGLVPISWESWNGTEGIWVKVRTLDVGP